MSEIKESIQIPIYNIIIDFENNYGICGKCGKSSEYFYNDEEYDQCPLVTCEHCSTMSVVCLNCKKWCSEVDDLPPLIYGSGKRLYYKQYSEEDTYTVHPLIIDHIRIGKNFNEYLSNPNSNKWKWNRHISKRLRKYWVYPTPYLSVIPSLVPIGISGVCYNCRKRYVCTVIKDE